MKVREGPEENSTQTDLSGSSMVGGRVPEAERCPRRLLESHGGEKIRTLSEGRWEERELQETFPKEDRRL